MSYTQSGTQQMAQQSGDTVIKKYIELSYIEL